MSNSIMKFTPAALGSILLAACSSHTDSYELWLVATPSSLSSPASSTIKATVKSSGADFSGAVTFAVSGCGTVTPDTTTAAAGIAMATFTPGTGSLTENCAATINAEATNGRKWPFKTSYATGKLAVTVLPLPVTSASAPASANPAGRMPTRVIVKPSVTAQTWDYELSLNPVEGTNDRIVMLNIKLDVACPKPSSTGFAPTITPESGTSKTWSIQYPGSGVTNDDVAFAKCEGKPGGTAQFDIRLNTTGNIVPPLSATGPR